MKFYIETERLILRDMLETDDAGMFELDSNSEVLRYLHTVPHTQIEQAQEIIARVHQQYINHGIGRWSVIEKTSGDFIGWSGLKLVVDTVNQQTNYYDVGYRFISRYWGKGYATESTQAALQYAFAHMQLKEVIGTCHIENNASRNVLEKCGLRFIEQFNYNQMFLCDWLKLTKEEWEQLQII